MTRESVMIQGLFETHINVSDLERSIAFYRDVLGLELGLLEQDRRAAFFWIGGRGEAMLGIWEKPREQVVRQHFAFRVTIEDVLNNSVRWLNARGLTSRNFLNDGTQRPMVFGWMPAIAIYFEDPDGHSLELIAMLPDKPRPDLGVVSWEEWQTTARVCVSGGRLENNRMQKITPCLWFDGQAEEAAKFYCSVFKNSRITNILRHGEAGPGPKGTVLLVSFQLEGQDFLALNGGPQFKFNEAISLSVDCKDQAEVDALWRKLTSDGGKESQCSWLKDKYGVSWQIVPSILPQLLNDPDPQRAARAMKAMMQMSKIDIQRLKDAVDGK